MRPLVAESVVLPFSELVLDRALKASVAVDFLNSRRAVHGAHVAAERDTAAGRGTVAALFLLAVARSMSAVANSAVDGRELLLAAGKLELHQVLGDDVVEGLLELGHLLISEGHLAGDQVEHEG